MRRKFIRFIFSIGMVGVIALPTMPISALSAHAQTAARTINGIEVSGRFLEMWSRHGSERDSVYVNGLPITPRRPEISVEDGRAYETQWFERARYEMHPASKAPNDVMLGRLGASRAEGRGKIDPATGKVVSPGDEPFLGVDQPADLSAGKLWFPETRHTLSGKLLDAWNRYGGLTQFGFPLSEPFQEVSEADGKAYMVQYFERNRFELHPEKPAPYDVELGLLGVEQYGLMAVPGDALPVAPPKDVKSTKSDITIALWQEPHTLSVLNNEPATRRVRSFIEDQLVGRDDNDNLFPLDAWYVPTLENGGAQFMGEGDDRYLRVKYKIRQGIKWNDGVELTSNDAIFAYRLIMNSEVQAPGRSEYVRLQNVDNPDKYTVIYNYRSLNQLKTYYNSLRDRENYYYLHDYIFMKKPVTSRAYAEVGAIYPEHLLGKIPPAKMQNDPVSRAPVGTGPYRVERWIEASQILLVPNDYYSLTAKPAIKKITLKFYADLNAGWSHVVFGEYDLVSSELLTSPPGDPDSLMGRGLSVVSRPAVVWEHLDFRFDYGPFKDHAVREAIFRAINRQRIIEQAYGGVGGIMNGVVPPSVYFSLENPHFARNFPDIAAKYKLPIYPYDPERARQLLEEAGWKVGPDGVRAKGGVKLSFIYGTTTQALRQKIQALVVADLKAIGVDAIAKNYPASLFFDTSVESPRANGIIKLAQFAWQTTRESDFSSWSCREGLYNPIPVGYGNDQAYCNEKVSIADYTFISEVELQTQVVAAAEAQVTLMQDIVVVPLVQRANIEIVKDKLANYKITNSLTSSFWNARQWYFR
ncbi:MAG TPA: peptide ABC transporter substrate-binding protein [Chloroflexia bacterium]|nr:peptide ABC transporter substrate-binding protein [Chloroflexia bacterium]